MTATKTTVYLLSDKDNDSILLILDALSEYALNHLEKLQLCKALSAQIIHCRDNFSEPYKVKQ